MARLIWTRRAIDDLEHLLTYIERDAPLAAKRLAKRIVERAESLQDHPHLGGFVLEDDTRTYREILQGPYRLIYREQVDVVYLITIHHAARLLEIDEEAN